jgi:hypothetical protein
LAEADLDIGGLVSVVEAVAIGGNYCQVAVAAALAEIVDL